MSHMAIFGVALLSLCMFAGMLIGDILGKLAGIDSNIGGVGFAMLLLLLITDKLLRENRLSQEARDSIKFWSNMYIPIIVAMTATQNAASALSGSMVSILAGVLAVAVAFMLVPVICKIGGKEKEFRESTEVNDELI